MAWREPCHQATHCPQEHRNELALTLDKAELVCEAMIDFELDRANKLKEENMGGILGMLFTVVARLEQYRPFLPDHLFAKEEEASERSEMSDEDSHAPSYGYVCGTVRGGRGGLSTLTLSLGAPRAGLCLKGRGAVSERLQSGHRGCQSGWGWGGFWRLEMRLGLELGQECLWGRVSAVGRGEGGNPPPPSSSDSLPQGPPWVSPLPPQSPILSASSPTPSPRPPASVPVLPRPRSSPLPFQSSLPPPLPPRLLPASSGSPPPPPRPPGPPGGFSAHSIARRAASSQSITDQLYPCVRVSHPMSFAHELLVRAPICRHPPRCFRRKSVSSTDSPISSARSSVRSSVIVGSQRTRTSSLNASSLTVPGRLRSYTSGGSVASGYSHRSFRETKTKKNFDMDVRMKNISLVYLRFQGVEEAADRGIDTAIQTKFISAMNVLTRVAVPIIKCVAARAPHIFQPPHLFRTACLVHTTHASRTTCLLHYITLHYVTLHYITLRYVTLRYVTLRYVTLRYVTLHYITLHYITLHYITLHYITLHYITLHYITLHYITHVYLCDILQTTLIRHASCMPHTCSISHISHMPHSLIPHSSHPRNLLSYHTALVCLRTLSYHTCPARHTPLSYHTRLTNPAPLSCHTSSAHQTPLSYHTTSAHQTPLSYHASRFLLHVHSTHLYIANTSRTNLLHTPQFSHAVQLLRTTHLFHATSLAYRRPLTYRTPLPYLPLEPLTCHTHLSHTADLHALHARHRSPTAHVISHLDPPFGIGNGDRSTFSWGCYGKLRSLPWAMLAKMGHSHSL